MTDTAVRWYAAGVAYLDEAGLMATVLAEAHAVQLQQDHFAERCDQVLRVVDIVRHRFRVVERVQHAGRLV